MLRYKSFVAMATLFVSIAAFADVDPMAFAQNEQAQQQADAQYRANQRNEPINNSTTIKPGSLRRVNVSQDDVNMLECVNGAITDRTFSTEKPMSFATNQGNDSFAFVKFAKQQMPDGEIQVYTKETELYVTCGGDVYSLLMVPTNIPTQRIILDSGRKQELESNISIFKELDIEDAAVTLIDKAEFEPSLPDSYTVKMADVGTEWIDVIPAVKARLVRTIKPEGVGLVVYEYLVYSTLDMNLNEFDFAKLKANSFAVRIAKTSLKAREATKVFVVERLWR